MNLVPRNSERSSVYNGSGCEVWLLERVCLDFVCDVVYPAGSRIPSLYAISDQSNKNVEANVIHNQGARTTMVDLEL